MEATQPGHIKEGKLEHPDGLLRGLVVSEKTYVLSAVNDAGVKAGIDEGNIHPCILLGVRLDENNALLSHMFKLPISKPLDDGADQEVLELASLRSRYTLHGVDIHIQI